MRTRLAYSTLRPPPFVSMWRGPVYAFPPLEIRPSHRNPAPIPHTGTSHHPSHFFSSLLHNDSVLGGRTNDNGLGETHVVWNFTDVNQTTPVTMTSILTSEKPSFPAGYPSGYTWTHIVCASVIVTVVMLIIVVGNFLVMWAIVRDKNLKGTQNYFIGSLALADFLLGLLIVPFSLANELMGYWYFGAVFCEVWKAVDVLLCTASISSLCLISLDRYWSITKAIHYSRQRTPKRAAIMIFIVWFLSAAICIPPLIGWNQPTPDSDWPTCNLSEDIGYVLYSSMGSFYIPAFIMVFVYFKIYQAAKARARKNVTKTPRITQSEKSELRNSTESSFNEHQHFSQQKQEQIPLQHPHSLSNTITQQVTAVEQTGSCSTKVQLPVQFPSAADTDSVVPVLQCRCVQVTADDVVTPAIPSGTLGMRQELDFRSRSVSLPCRTLVSSELTKLLVSTDSDSCEALSGPSLNRMERSRSCFYNIPTTTTTDTDSSMDQIYTESIRHQSHASSKTQSDAKFVPEKANSPANSRVCLTKMESRDNGSVQHFTILEPKHNGNAREAVSVTEDKDGGLFGSLKRQWLQQNNGKIGEKRKTLPGKKKGQKKVGRGEDFSSAERHKRKMAKARERRATLVLGLVMAAFILCWSPFFLLYVLSAFCVGCIPMMVFTVFFWIGYGNSALNPIIYTVFNRDFRRAFHRILFGRRRGWR